MGWHPESAIAWPAITGFGGNHTRPQVDPLGAVLIFRSALYHRPQWHGMPRAGFCAHAAGSGIAWATPCPGPAGSGKNRRCTLLAASTTTQGKPDKSTTTAAACQGLYLTPERMPPDAEDRTREETADLVTKMQPLEYFPEAHQDGESSPSSSRGKLSGPWEICRRRTCTRGSSHKHMEGNYCQEGTTLLKLSYFRAP